MAVASAELNGVLKIVDKQEVRSSSFVLFTRRPMPIPIRSYFSLTD